MTGHLQDALPLVSVVFLAADDTTATKRTLASVAKQTYRPLEVVFLAETKSAIDKHGLDLLPGDIPFRLVVPDPSLPPAAMANFGIKEVDAEYVGIIRSGDYWFPAHVEILASALNALDYGAAFGDVEGSDPSATDADLAEAGEFRENLRPKYSFNDLLVDDGISLAGTLFRRELLVSVGGFDESLSTLMDWDLMIRCGAVAPYYHVRSITSRRHLPTEAEDCGETARTHIFQKHGSRFTPDAISRMREYRKENERLRQELKMIPRLEEEIRARRDHILDLSEQLRGEWLERTRRDAEYEEAIRQYETELIKLKEIQDRELREQDAEILRNNQLIAELEREHKDRFDELTGIQNSRGWKLLTVYYKTRDVLLPRNSRRRMWAKFAALLLREPRSVLGALRPENLKKFGAQYKSLSPEALETKVRGKVASSRQVRGNSPRHVPSGEETFAVDVKTMLPDPDPFRILIVDRWLPEHDKDSGAVRMFSLLKILVEEGFRVSFLPNDLQRRSPYDQDLEDIGVECIYGPVNLEDFFAKEGRRFSWILLSRPEQAYRFLPIVRSYAIHSKVIYDTVDLHWVRFERGARYGGDSNLEMQARKYRKLELFNAECSDITLTVTEDERVLLLKEIDGLDVKVLPNIHMVEENVPPYSTRKDLMFIGGYSHKPNEDAMVYFVKEVFPAIRGALPGIRLFAVGSEPSKAVLDLAGPDVEITGWVRDVRPYFEGCRVFVSPLRYGAGMKGKIGQSMSFGVPVVTTTIGAEGIGLVDGVSALVADNPADFSSAVVRLYQDEELWNKLSGNALNIIKENYSHDAIRRRVGDIFRKAHGARRSTEVP